MNTRRSVAERGWLVALVVASALMIAAPILAGDATSLAALRVELETMREADQALRLQIHAEERKAAVDAAAIKALGERQEQLDADNQQRLIEIVDEFGWPRPSMVGERAASTAFLIIQHAEADLQRRFLPDLREAAKAGDLELSQLALLEDRVLLADGKPQRYGTQVKALAVGGPYQLQSLEDAATVDERRASMGLGPLADYLKRWNIEWPPAAQSPR